VNVSPRRVGTVTGAKRTGIVIAILISTFGWRRDIANKLAAMVQGAKLATAELS
jgi:hypothetical protein